MTEVAARGTFMARDGVECKRNGDTLRHAAKRDDSEKGIVQALELAGWTVIRLSDKGAPDLLAIRLGRCVPIECKSPGGTLTPAQEEAFRRWESAGLPVKVAFTPADAIVAVAQGVESVLQPLDVACECGHLRGFHSSAVASCLSDDACRCERFAPARANVITPAYQKAQTAAVVPARRKK